MILLLENNIREGIGSVIGNRYVKSDENKKILFNDANNLYRHSMSNVLPHDGNEMSYGHPNHYSKNLEEFLRTPDDSEVG